MKLRIFSDLHLEHGNMQDIAAIEPGDEDVVVCAGDLTNDGINGLMWLRRKFPDGPIVFVMGNHEYYGSNMAERENDMRAVAQDLGIELLLNSSVVIDDIKFVGTTLWSDFNLYAGTMAESMRKSELWVNDFHLISVNPNRRLSAEYVKLHLFNDAARFLLTALPGNPDKTVAVTHFAACSKSVAPPFVGDVVTPYFVNNCDHLLPMAKLWIHGHTHAAFDYEVSGSRVVCNPGGYRHEKSGFNPNKVVEV